jgi:hypothetical protein
MSYRPLTLAFWAFLLLPATALGQNRTVSGKVLDPQNKGIDKVRVVLRSSSSKLPIHQTITEKDGSYTLSIPSAGEGEYELFTKAIGYKAQKVSVTSNSPPENPVDLILEKEGSLEFSRAIIALEQSGASAAESQQKFFFDLSIELGLGLKRKEDDLGPRLSSWGTVRVTTVPQQITSGVGTFVAEFPQRVADVKVNEVAQAAELLAGGEFRFWQSAKAIEVVGTHHIVSLSLFAGGGIITPLTPRQTLEVFETSPEAIQRFGISDQKKFIAFVSPDRDRFFRQYYLGLRFKTHYFEWGQNTERYPAILDVSLGQNESVTGGRLNGIVLRLEGFYALPLTKGTVSLFGTALLQLKASNISDPLILKRAPPNISVPSPDVAIVTIPQINRDYYRIGVGIDLVQVIKAWGGSGKKD